MAEANKPWWREHLGVLVSAGVAGFVILRLLGASGWDVTTALAIASTSNTASIAINSVLASVPLMFLFVLGVTSPLIVDRLRRAHLFELLMFGVPMAVGVVPVLGIIPALNLALAALTAVPVWVVARRSADREAERLIERVGDPGGSGEADPRAILRRMMNQLAMMMAAIVLALAVLTSRTPWLPTEALTISTMPSFTGYVVAEQGPDIVVLRDDDRRIVRTQSGTLTRSICSRSSFTAMTVPELIWGLRYPACP